MCGLRTLSSVDPVLERVRSVSGISLCCLRARTGSEADRASGVKPYFSPLMRSLDPENVNVYIVCWHSVLSVVTHCCVCVLCISVTAVCIAAVYLCRLWATCAHSLVCREADVPRHHICRADGGGYSCTFDLNISTAIDSDYPARTAAVQKSVS